MRSSGVLPTGSLFIQTWAWEGVARTSNRAASAPARDSSVRRLASTLTDFVELRMCWETWAEETEVCEAGAEIVLNESVGFALAATPAAIEVVAAASATDCADTRGTDRTELASVKPIARRRAVRNRFLPKTVIATPSSPHAQRERGLISESRSPSKLTGPYRLLVPKNLVSIPTEVSLRRNPFFRSPKSDKRVSVCHRIET